MLEHLDDISIFFKNLPVKKNIFLMIEVPNGYRAINQLNRFEDLVYEHVSYFSTHSLKKILFLNNFRVIDDFSLLNEDNIVCLAFRGDKKIFELIKKRKFKILSKEYYINEKNIEGVKIFA